MSRITSKNNSSCKMTENNISTQKVSNLSSNFEPSLKILRHETIKRTKFCDVIANPAVSNVFVCRKRGKKLESQRSFKGKMVPGESLKQSEIKNSDQKSLFVNRRLTTPIMMSPEFGPPWSKGKHEVFPPPPAFEELSGLDLSHLSPEERAVILQVAARAKQIEQVESQKLEKIQEQVQSFATHPEVNANEEKSRNIAATTSEKVKKLHDTPKPTEIKKATTIKEASKNNKNEKPQVPTSLINDKKNVETTKITPAHDRSNATKPPKNNSVIPACHACLKPLFSNTKTNKEGGQETAVTEEGRSDQSLPNDLPQCSSCLQPTCDACSSPSVLAKKGDRLCQRCLKQRELAARSNVWMNDKRYLFRSASDHIPHETISLLQSEESSKQSKTNSFRSRSLSATGIIPDPAHFGKLSAIVSPKELYPGKEQKNQQVGGNFGVMSVAEELIRRNSIKDEAITRVQQNNDNNQTKIKEKMNQNYDVPGTTHEKKGHLTNKDQTQKRIAGEKSSSLLMKDMTTEAEAKEKEKNSQPPAKVAATGKDTKEKNVLLQTKTNKHIKEKIGRNEVKDAIKINDIPAAKLSARNDDQQKNAVLPSLTSASHHQRYDGNSPVAVAASLPYVSELKKLFNSKRKPLASEIKRNNIDLKRSSSDLKPNEFNNDRGSGFKQGHVRDKVYGFVDKPIKEGIKTDDFSLKSANVATITTSTNSPTKPYISEKAQVVTSQPIKISQVKPTEQRSKINHPLQIAAPKESEVKKSNSETSHGVSSSNQHFDQFVAKDYSSSRIATNHIIRNEMKNISGSTTEKNSTAKGKDKANQDRAFSLIEAKRSAEGLESTATSRDEERTTCTRTTSVVSSLAESEGPAEWSVDEMDDGDTLFLVTSSENVEQALPSGITTPNNLRSVASDQRMYMTSSSASTFSTSDVIQNSFEINFDENDTEGDFSHLIYEEDEKMEHSQGSLKRTSLFHDLSFESRKDRTIDKISNTKTMNANDGKFATSTPDKRNLQIDHKRQDNENKSSRSTKSDKLLIVPGESLFKRTKCEIDEEIDFYEDQINRSAFTKSFQSDTSINSFHPIPAKRSQKHSSSNTMDSNLAVASDTSQFASNSDDSNNLGFNSKLNEENQLRFNKRLQSNTYEATDMSKKSQYANKFGTKILQTPSGARLPISPLAKNNVSSQCKSSNSSAMPPSIHNSGTVLAVCGKGYFDSDSESECTDSEEEHNILLAATTSEPVHPEEMKASGQDAIITRSRGKNSFFFRRTTSTDNFETLLQNNTETPRSPRRTLSNSTRSKSPNLMNLYQENKSDSSLSPSGSLSNYPSKVTTDASKLERNKSDNRNFSDNLYQEHERANYYSSVENSNIDSSTRFTSFHSPKILPSKKDTTVILSPGAVKESGNETHSHSADSLSRCVPCGVLTQQSDTGETSPSIVVPATTIIVKEEPIRKQKYEESSGIKSVNSSTQVTPDKENPPFNVASIDLCQLTALIQALRNVNDVTADSKPTEPREAIKETSSAKASTFTTTTYSQPVTCEPQPMTSPMSNKLNTRDVATDTRSENYSVITPRDKIVICREYGHDRNSQYYESEPSRSRFYSSKADAGVGTDDNELFLPSRIPPLPNKLFSPGFSDPQELHASRSLYLQPHRNYPYRYVNTMMHPYGNIGRNYFGMPDLNNCNVAEKQMAPSRDYYLQRRTTIGEIEMHSNLYDDLLHADGARATQPYYPSSFAFDRPDQQMSMYPQKIPQYSSDAQYVTSLNPTSYNPTKFIASPSSQMIKFKESMPRIERTNTENMDFVFPNYQANDGEKPGHIPQQSVENMLPYYGQKENLEFLRQEDPEVRRSASVPVTTRSKSSATPVPTSNYMVYRRQQPSQKDPATHFRTISHPENVRKDYNIDTDQSFYGDKDLPEEPNHENIYISSSSSVTAPRYSGLDTQAPSMRFQNMNTASSRFNNSDTRLGEVNYSYNPAIQTHNHDYSHYPPMASKGLRYEKQPHYQPKSDVNVQKSYNSLPSAERRTAARDRDDMASGDSQLFRQTLEDLEQEEKELDMKLRYLELGRGRTTSSSSYTKSGKYHSSTTLNTKPDLRGDHVKGPSSSKRAVSRDTSNPELGKVEYKSNVLDNSNRTLSDRNSPLPEQKRNYVVVNNVDQIFEEERRRRRRGEETTFKQDFGRNSRTSNVDRAHYWQAPYQKPISTSTVAPSSIQLQDKHAYQSWQHHKQPNMETNPSLTGQRIAKSYTNESNLRSSGSKMRPDDCCNRTCAQNQGHRIQSSSTMHGNYSSYNQPKKNVSPRTHYSQHKRHPNNDQKSCASQHPHSNPRCYQVNYVMQDHDDVSSPWKRIAKEQQNLIPDLYQDTHHNRTFYDQRFNPNIATYKHRANDNIEQPQQVSALASGDKNSYQVENKRIHPSNQPTDISSTLRDNFDDEYRTRAEERDKEQVWDESDLTESSHQEDDSRHVVSDTEEYNLRKERNIDWFDKPIKNKKQENSTYAEFSNNGSESQRK